MAVLNGHERGFGCSPDELGALVDGLAGAQDRLWPHQTWPRMRFDRPLGAGAVGGHGPIRYTVTGYEPGRWIRFGFTGPRGFDGYHEYTVAPEDGPGTTVRLRHTLAMDISGPARLSWPLVYQSLHDALIEDSLERAELAVTGKVREPARWSPYVRLLRRLFGGKAGRVSSPGRTPG